MEWTPNCHGSFEGFREDEPARLIRRAAQLDVIEFHTWNSKAQHINEPDRVIFDLKPGKGVAWPRIQEAAILTRTLLFELGLSLGSRQVEAKGFTCRATRTGGRL